MQYRDRDTEKQRHRNRDTDGIRDIETHKQRT